MLEGRFLIGGCVFQLNLDGVSLLDWPHPFYTPFQTRLSPDIFVVVRRVKKLPISPDPKKNKFTARFMEIRDWEIFDDAGQYSVNLFNSATDRCNKRALVSSDFSHAELFVTLS